MDIEEGKTLIVKLIYVSEPNEDGSRILTFELNGKARECVIADKSIKSETKRRVKADSADPKQTGAYSRDGEQRISDGWQPGQER